jgi:hypothetical protein
MTQSSITHCSRQWGNLELLWELQDFARPLYQIFKDAQWDSKSLFEWDLESVKAFQTLKWSLQMAPALSLPTHNCF